MRWSNTTITAITAAAAAARAGSPTVVAIEGRPGYGKSTLLRAATTTWLPGFHLLRAYGEQSTQDDRYQLLDQWELTHPTNVLQATRLLTSLVDRLLLTGPVCLIVDDLQWIDPESVEALATLAQRSVGDRLLILTASRPLRRRHPTWRRLPATTIHLDGLDCDAAAALVAATNPEAPAGLAEALRAHTDSSPLHIRALLQEHPAGELAALAERGELPAPADLSAAVDARITELDPHAARLLHALAVLGDTWSDAATAAAIAEVTDVDTATTTLVDEELLLVDRTGPAPRIRIVHAVLRAAAYETIPVQARRALHRAAAARLSSTGERLRHRLAAVAGPDEGLAADLDRYADDRHEQRRFREAARFRRLAASISRSAAAAEHRQLDADIESLLANDPDGISVTDLTAEASAQRRLVYAMRKSSEMQWVQAAAVFDEINRADLDPRNAYRALVVHAWTILASGRPAADALPLLQAALASPVTDSIYLGLLLTTNGQVQHATIDRSRQLWAFDDARDTDRQTLASTPPGLHQLSWRGAVYATTGSTGRAVDDLTVVTDRMGDGQLELTDGVLHSFLGLAQWASGEWRRASITLGLAQTLVRGAIHPTVAAIAPLAAVVSGEDPRPALLRSRNARLAGPLPVAMYVGDTVDVAALAFTGTPQERRQWRARRIADFGTPDPHSDGRPPSLWLLAMGLGAAWAGDASAVDSWADTLAAQAGGEWRPNAVTWLHAHAAQVRGQTTTPLASVAGNGLPGLDSFAALLCADALRDRPDDQLLHRAQTVFERIGAGLYTSSMLPHVIATPDPLAPLSDRERDVAALLLEGLSYAQIANELHVSRGTVAFHLSNIYAKTNTTSRHELIELNRRPTAIRS